MANELTLIVDNEALLKEVTFNYENLKTALTARLESYKKLVVTEDAITSAKQDRANLNKLESALKEKQKEIQMRMLGGFDEKLKELRSMIKSASDSIDEQVKYFEQVTKDSKKKEIEALYADNIGDLADLVPFDRLFNPKWLNKTASIKNIEADLTNAIAKIREDIVILDALGMPDNIALPVKDCFFRTLDTGAAMREKVRLEKSQADLAERQRKLAEEKARQEEAVGRLIQPSIPAEFKIIEEAKDGNPPLVEVTPLEQIDFRVWVNPEQKMALRQFLRENHIKTGKIE